MEKVLGDLKVLVASLSPDEIKQEPEGEDSDEICTAATENDPDEQQKIAIYRNSQCFKVLDKYMKEEATYDQLGKQNKSDIPSCIEKYKKSGNKPKTSSFFGESSQSSHESQSQSSSSSSQSSRRRSLSQPALSQPEAAEPTLKRFPFHCNSEK